ncbi:phosphatidylglycerol lysyltransferase domain-containing protein [uncultured Sulfitobacter sp.]|uniref:phosphatidylglycerol lysyltransferase domain-containing protein n=1 Tax=uncultured Sulfitobacter sp. TaxID=191468 RepID=UPI0030FAAD81
MMKRLLSGQGTRAAQLAVSVAIGAVCLWVLTGQLSAGFWQDVTAELRGLDPLSVMLAACCTGLSFLALGRYDAVAHRHLGSGTPTLQACGAGTIAIALAQTLGLGVLTGALARWRMLPDISMALALRLSVFVCLTFMVALLVVTAVACLVFPAPAFMFWPSVIVVAALPAAVVGLYLCPALTLGRFTVRLPSLRALASILLWTVIDVLAASTALYLLIPGGEVPFTVLFPLFLVALGSALLSGTPGGVGPFELVLFAALPGGASVQVLTGIIAFRAVYYAIPALIAMALMLRPYASVDAIAPRAHGDISTAPRAEVGVIRQNGGFIADHSALWHCGQTLCALFDPLSSATRDPIATVSSHARDRNLIPALYKCSARTALLARQQGWFVSHIADEATLNPLQFITTTAPFRSLRRKLRAADKAQITISQVTPLPVSDMARVDNRWQQARGGARGGTMGIFAPEYVAHQRVYLAHHKGHLVAFASFHETTREWCLDLMRQDPSAPDGTMHALVHAAIGDAATQGIARLSLAAVPACPDPSSALMVKLAQIAVRKTGGPGLRQFKSNFRPTWQPLYAAAPNRALLALALGDIARAVHRPSTATNDTNSHYDDENYEVASRLAS